MSRPARATAPSPDRPIALVSPAGPIHPTTLADGLAAMVALDIPVADHDDSLALERQAYLAGPDASRAAALRRALDLQPAGLWMTRGGYGSIRTLEALAPSGGLAASPATPLWAFSDGTALLAAWTALGWPCWHAPPLSQLPRLPDADLARVRAAVHADHVAPFEGLLTLAPGQAQGPLLGGNLTVLASLVGTRWAPDLRGAIVLLEDVHEPPYRVDRAFTQLLLAGAFDGIAGLVLGDFTGLRDDQRAQVMDFFARATPALGVPVAGDLPVGHDLRNAPLPFGTGGGFVATLTASDATATLAFDRADA